jgi:hypothetical protein
LLNRICQLHDHPVELLTAQLGLEVIDVACPNPADVDVEEVADLAGRVLATGVSKATTGGDLDTVDHDGKRDRLHPNWCGGFYSLTG